MSLKKKGMFGEAKTKSLASIVKLDTLPNAKTASKKLLKRFGELKHRDAKVKLKRATVLAANRAKIIANNTKNPRIKNEKMEMVRTYRNAAKKMVLGD